MWGVDVVIADVEADPQPQIDEVDPSASALESATQELNSTIIQVVKQFSTLLDASSTVSKEKNDDEWENWWLEGWFREFCRSVSFSFFLLSLKGEDLIRFTRGKYSWQTRSY